MARGAITVKIDGQYDDKDINRAIRDLQRLKSDAGATKGPMDGLTGAMKGLAAGAAAALSIGAVVDYLKDAATAAAQDEKSMVALATAMDNVGQGFAKTSAEKFIKEMMLATGVADDELRPAFQRLVTATGDAAKSQELLTTALDISAATGKDVVSVSQALARASMGQFTALTRLGIPLDANIVKTKDFGAAVDALNQKFGGQAAAAAGTYGGQLKRVQTAAAEAQETIGYALLDAISDVSEAFGGTGGAVNALTGFGNATANFVTGVGLMATEVAKLTAAITANTEEGTDWGNVIQASAHALDVINPVFSNFVDSVMLATDLGAAQTAVEKAKADEISGVTALYAGYKANSDRAHSATIALTQAAEDEADALQAVSDAAKVLLGVISNSQSMDDFRKKLADLDITLEGNKRSFKGMGDGAKENRDTLRDALSEATRIAQKWVDDGKISADQYQAAYRGLAKQTVNQFVDDGFKRKDIEKFLGDEGMWTGPIKENLTAAEKAALATARSSGSAVGRDFALGVGNGIILHSSYVQKMTRQLVIEAEAAARNQAQSQSPSKLFAKVGTDLVDGLIVGMDSKKQAAADKARETIQALLDKATEMVDKYDTRLSNLRGSLDDATKAVTDWAKSTSDALVSAFDTKAIFAGSYDEAGNFVASKWQSGWDTAMKQFEWYANVLTAIKSAGGSDALVAFLQSQGIENGGKWGQALIDNGLVADMNSKLGLVQSTADTTAQALVPSFLTSAQQSAQALLDEFFVKYGKDGEYRARLQNLMDRLARAMDRTVTMTVRTVYEAAGLPRRAMGGPVSANTAYVVGEKGPEVFVPDSGGNILANSTINSGSLGGGNVKSGNTYAITVQTGVGDPRMIGQQVVEYIKKYEAANGPAFAAA